MIFPPAVSGAVAAYEIGKSVRFRASGSASLSRTPSVAGNRKKLAMRFRVKRGVLGTLQVIASAGTANIDRFYFDTSNRLCLDVLGTSRLVTTPVFRDPSAWYVDVGFELDVANGTAASRAKILIDGTEVSTYSTDTRSSITNTDTNWNNTVIHYIGRDNAGNYFDGYLAEPVLADGTLSLSYSELDLNGVRNPLRPSATYGTNGFYLPFSDGTSLSTLTADASGNGNNWTANNISLTAGVNYDWMEDTPTNNFAVLNPLDTSQPVVSLTQGGLLLSSSTTVSATALSTVAIPLGYFYYETGFTVHQANTGGHVGVSETTNGATGVLYRTDGFRLVPGGSWVSYGASYTVGDVVGVATDRVAGTVEFFKNGVSQGVISHSGLTSNSWFAVIYTTSWNSTNISTKFANFGQRPFAYTPPTGYQKLCTANLPAPAIAKPSDHFDVKLYVGNASTQNITGLDFRPDLVWMKSRGRAVDHAWYDSVRGVQKQLESNTTGAETTETTGLTAFNSDGWTMGALDQINNTTATNAYVGWAWKANGAAVTNTDGSITSQVSANTTAGFSIVTYTGTGANATVGHGLGVAPKMIIIKGRVAQSTTSHWAVYHDTLGVNGRVWLNLTSAVGASASYWNSTAPNSSVFSLGTEGAANEATRTYVAYCFAEVPGFSRIGSYTGNGSADGPFVYCGFLPRWVVVKRTDFGDTNTDWVVYDAARSPTNINAKTLWANQAFAEITQGATGNRMDTLANGFELRDTGSATNASGGTYVFLAFAESPFNFSRAR